MTTKLTPVQKPTYYCDDAAARIAELIEEAEEKLSRATRLRDKHRGETAIRAYREALILVLLERECIPDGAAHPMPDADEYLKQRKRPRTN